MIVTHHALLRFIERTMGFTEAEAQALAVGEHGEAIRAMMAKVPGLEAAVRAGASAYADGSVTYRFRDGYVITVQPNGSPYGAYREGEAHAYGHAQRGIRNGAIKGQRRREPRRGKRKAIDHD